MFDSQLRRPRHLSQAVSFRRDHHEFIKARQAATGKSFSTVVRDLLDVAIAQEQSTQSEKAPA